MEQFEYKTVFRGGKDVDDASHSLTDKLNAYGKDGWELVSSLAQPSLGSSQYSLIGITGEITLIFKRRLEQNLLIKSSPKMKLSTGNYWR